MTPQQDVQDWIRKTVAQNDVVLFMKGTKAMPQCGFSMQVAQILGALGIAYNDVNVLENMGIREGIKSLFQLADHPAALRQGRVHRRLRHRPRDGGGGRAAAAARVEGHRPRRLQADGLAACATSEAP